MNLWTGTIIVVSNWSMEIRTKILFSLIVGLLCFNASAQKKRINIERAGLIETGKMRGERFTKFADDVVFEHNELRIFCDSAFHFKKDNRIEAYGHVKILQDSVTIVGDHLRYYGDTKIAKMRNNVVFDNRIVTVYTDHLDFDRMTNLAHYFNNGKLVDSINVVTSGKGYYKTTTKIMSFKKDVVMVGPEYDLKSDTMVYNTISRIVHFVAPTELIDGEGNVINYNEGQYNTNIRISNLFKGDIETEKYILSGDRLTIDNQTGYFRAVTNVVIFSKEDSIEIHGAVAEHWKYDGITKIYGKPYLKKFMGGDTLYLSADTLISFDFEDESKNHLLAYNNVLVYKSDMQGIADSVAYMTTDSTIFFYHDPVIWFEGKNQILAEVIDIKLTSRGIDKMNMNGKAFIIFQDTIKNFNQIKGREMEAHFEENQFDKLDVNGNGESIFFALNEDETAVVGMNKIECSEMLINFENNQVNNISFYTSPEAEFIPPHQLKEPQTRLKDFKWRIKERPEKHHVITGTKPKPEDSESQHLDENAEANVRSDPN